MDHTELFVASIVVNVATTALVVAVVSYIAVEYFHRHTKWRLARQEADLVWRTELLTEQAAVQLNQGNELRVREETTAELERDLRQKIQLTAMVLHATQEALNDDTTIMDLDQQWLPELRDQLNDTVMLPRIEEEL